MRVLLKLFLFSYVMRKTRDFIITANVIVLFLLWVMKKSHVNLFNDCTASVYLNAQGKHKQITPFLYV